MNDVFIECKNLTLKRGSKSLLENVSFSILKGQHRVVLGPNGAGKSTLIRMILGLLKPTEGEVLLNGKNQRDYSRLEMARLLAYVPQLLAAEIPYTVKEFVSMGCYASRGASSHDAVEKAMRVVRVSQFSDRVVSTLSGGERQRVCIAAALAQEALLIVLDEPLVHLDPGQRRDVQQVIRELKESVTVLVVTHDLAWAQKDFKNLFVLEDSKLTYDGELEPFYANGGITKLFGKDVYEQGEVNDAH